MNSTLSNVTLGLDVVVQMSLLSVLLAVDVCLNVYVMFVLLWSARVDLSVVFNLNLLLSDLLLSVSSVLFIVLWVRFNSVVMIFLNLLTGTSLSSRLLFLGCVCLERYLAVLHPVIFLKLKPLRYRLGCSALGWIFSVALGITAPTKLDASSRYFSILFVIILTLEVFFCVEILRRLRHPGPSEELEMNSVKRKAFQIISFTLLSCLLQNVPMFLWFNFSYIIPKKYLYTSINLCTNFYIISGFGQPLFLLRRAGRLSFRRCF